jgi:hypothetical protein
MQVVSKYRFRSKKEELDSTEAVCSSSVIIDLAHSSEIFPKRQHTSVFFFSFIICNLPVIYFTTPHVLCREISESYCSVSLF